MRYTNQSIKVRVINESYDFIYSTTRCNLKIRLFVTPVISYEYDVYGYANCNEDDEYIQSVGKKISKARAINKAYKAAYGYAVKHYKRYLMFNDAFSRFQHKVSDVVYGNINYINRFRNDTENPAKSEGKKE